MNRVMAIILILLAAFTILAATQTVRPTSASTCDNDGNGNPEPSPEDIRPQSIHFVINYPLIHCEDAPDSVRQTTNSTNSG